ncbi:MAG: hypothetical protein EU542_03225 [Promethearchaeota archaeon]|nr:MAG: hypothetical protein EU542_03225 [Candidatus Lokiarchaeota archaeon]
MGRTTGTFAILMGIVAIILELVIKFVFSFPYADIVFYILVALAIIAGIIGIASEDSRSYGLAGLLLGIIALVLWFVI